MSTRNTSTKRLVGRPPLPEKDKPVAVTVRMSRPHHKKFLRLAKKHGSQRKAQEAMIDEFSPKK